MPGSTPDPSASDDDLEAETEEQSERHASNLELFLDLVFVFAVTQIAGLFASDTGPGGFGRGVLLAWLVWWLWSQFTWLGTAINLNDRSLTQFLILAAVPLALLMAIAIPGAYGDSGFEFAGAYLAVNLWALAIQGRALWDVAATRQAWLQYVPLAAIAPVLVLVGAAFDREPRTVLWCVVAAFNIGAAVLAGHRGGTGDTQWTIDPVHFVERHSLFVIISLGEVLVAVGVAASETHLDNGIALGVVAAVSVACVFWWTYLSYVPGVIETVLRESVDRGRVARNMFSFGHFPIILGIVLYAVPAKHVVAHPSHELGTSDLVALAASVATFLGGFISLQWQNVRRVVPERVASVLIVTGMCALAGPHIPGGVTIALVGIVIGVSHTITIRRFARNVAAEVTSGEPA